CQNFEHKSVSANNIVLEKGFPGCQHHRHLGDGYSAIGKRHMAALAGLCLTTEFGRLPFGVSCLFGELAQNVTFAVLLGCVYIVADLPVLSIEIMLTLI